jgi:hypothetical protein
MDISSLTTLISTFRAETLEDAVTPESLGSLLQKIADALANASLQTDMTSIQAWRTTIANIGEIITALSVGSDDRNNVYLSYTKAKISTLSSTQMNDAIVIRQATTERAGAMRAQQVQDLNKCKTDISSIQTKITTATSTLNSLSSSLNSLAKRVTTAESNISTNDTEITQLQADIKSLQTDILTYTTMKQSSLMHIECTITNKRLKVQNAFQYVQQGLTPVIFRHTVRTSRKGKDEDGSRERLPTRHGWNRFYDDNKIKVSPSGLISFRVDDEDADNYGQYVESPDALFSPVRAIYSSTATSKQLQHLRLPFGKRIYDINSKSYAFRFAIGFYKKTSKSPTFQFSELQTNLAEFRVFVHTEHLTNNAYEIHYYLSM